MVKRIVNDLLDTVEGTVNEVEQEIESLMSPVRRSVLERFPVLFLLLVSFGVAAVMSGLERIITQIGFFDNNPFILLGVGLFVLVGTGTLYKKLG